MSLETKLNQAIDKYLGHCLTLSTLQALWEHLDQICAHEYIMRTIGVRVSPKIRVCSTQTNKCIPSAPSVNIDLVEQIELSQGILYTCTYCEREADFKDSVQLDLPCIQCLAHLRKEGRPMLNPGETWLYTEDNLRFPVKIIADRTDEKWYRVEVKIIGAGEEIGTNEDIIGPALSENEIGDVFTAKRMKNCAYGGMWHIRKSMNDAPVI